MGNFTFSQVPRADIPRSRFNRSHNYKTTFDSGLLIPIYADEALPGDTFNVKASVFARLATPIFPLMDNMTLDFFFFAVPNRLIWDNWQKFCGEQVNPDDSTDYLCPVLDLVADSVPGTGTIFDYFGLPAGMNGAEVSAFWLRAYNLVWNEWFRDQNLQDSVVVNKGDGPDDIADYTLLRRGKRHDYFTSCLPWPQKGPGVELPVGGYADVISDVVNAGNGRPYLGVPLNGGAMYNAPLASDTAFGGIAPGNPGYVPGGLNIAGGTAGIAAGQHDFIWEQSGLVADLSTATGVTINAMREAFQIQKLLERDARGGTRYVEILKSHFGVSSPDFRLQRPEFLGGGSVDVIINPVSQTSKTEVDSPQGNLAAYGVAGGHVGFSKSFVEHCVVLGLVCARADLTYQQGLHRMYSRRTRYDFYWPAFAHLGEQAVLMKEIYAQDQDVIDPATGASANETVFGYQERWAEYRYMPSKITGLFRSTAAASLDAWHLSQEFEAMPTLGADFIQENPPVDRVIAVPSEPHFLFDSYFKVEATRPMPTYSVPGLMDHF